MQAACHPLPPLQDPHTLALGGITFGAGRLVVSILRILLVGFWGTSGENVGRGVGFGRRVVRGGGGGLLVTGRLVFGFGRLVVGLGRLVVGLGRLVVGLGRLVVGMGGLVVGRWVLGRLMVGLGVLGTCEPMSLNSIWPRELDALTERENHIMTLSPTKMNLMAIFSKQQTQSNCKMHFQKLTEFNYSKCLGSDYTLPSLICSLNPPLYPNASVRSKTTALFMSESSCVLKPFQLDARW